MRVVAITGFSNTGKTTRIVEEIAILVKRGERVAAIKHTHHPLNDRDEGDTARFRAAGAHPVILAGDGEAVVFATNATRITYADPLELLTHVGDAEVVLVEGFKSFNGWPRIDSR
jgi:molybdopterin-guanine dinucleotide biosynthesis protein B